MTEHPEKGQAPGQDAGRCRSAEAGLSASWMPPAYRRTSRSLPAGTPASRAHTAGAGLNLAASARQVFLLTFVGVTSCRSGGLSWGAANGACCANLAAQRCSNFL
jgi:hypothetical protein